MAVCEERGEKTNVKWWATRVVLVDWESEIERESSAQRELILVKILEC